MFQEKAKMILDVGCGDNPRGDINVDRFLYSPQTGDQKHTVKTKADIIATGEYLPFLSNAFDKVIAMEVIEHSDYPFLFLKELVRVTKDKLEISCPYRLGKSAKMPYHKNYFNRKWFLKACNKLNCQVIENISTYQPMGFIFFIQRLEGLRIIIEKVVTVSHSLS